MEFSPWRNKARQVRVAAGFAGAGLAALLPLAALAEITNDGLIGPGLRLRPAYDGASAQRTELVPVIRYLGQPFFVRSTQGVLEGGVRTELATGLHAGAQLAYEPGRQAGDSAFLKSRQIADIRRGVSVGLQMEWDEKLGPMPVTLLARLRRHADSGLGAQADLRLSAGVFQGGPFSAGVFTQATWADATSTNARYGIGPPQSAASGLPVYQPGGGLLHASGGLLWSFDLGPQWVALGSLEVRRLRGDAAASPLVQRRWSGYTSVGLAYRF